MDFNKVHKNKIFKSTKVIMIKFLSKTTFLTMLVCCLTLLAKAQVGYNYSKVDLGTSLNFNSVQGDATKKLTSSYGFNITYHATPYWNFVLETQLGTLQGGNIALDGNNQPFSRYFKSNFTSFELREQLQFGEIIDYSDNNFYNAIKNFYSSIGVGVLINQATHKDLNNQSNPNSLITTNTNEMFIPLRVGYEFKIFNDYDQPYIKVDLGLQVNAMFSDYLDGYAYGSTTDFKLQETIGVKFAIGAGNISYRKQVSY